jgi:hypothetical protein
MICEQCGNLFDLVDPNLDIAMCPLCTMQVEDLYHPHNLATEEFKNLTIIDALLKNGFTGQFRKNQARLTYHKKHRPERGD